MKRIMTFTLATVVTVGIAATAWSQAGQGGGAGAAGAGGTGGAGGAGAAGTAGAGGTAGTAGAAGQAGTSGAGAGGTDGAGAAVGSNPATQGNRGNVGAAGAAGRANVGQNRLSAGAGANNNFNNGINQTPFFTDPGARRQLNLNDNQFNSLNRAYQDAYGRYSNNLRGLNSNLTEQQRIQQMQQFENQFRDDFGRTVDRTLTDRQARGRYDQLNRQFMGFNAFNDASIQQQLNLTPQQRQQLQRLAGDWRRQLQAGRGSAGLTQDQWAQMSSHYWDQLNSVLTPQQQQTWTQLTGQRYSFSPNLYQQNGNFNPRNGNAARNNVEDTNQINPGNNERQVVPFGGTPQGNQGQPGTGGAAPQGNSANSGTGTNTTR